MKKKGVLIITAAVIMIATAIGGTIAYFQADTSVQSQITTSAIGVSLIQTADSNKQPVSIIQKGIAYSGMPMDIVEEEVKAENSNQKPIYLRVTVNKYWKDKDNKKNMDADPKEIRIETDEKANWIIMDGDTYGEVLYYYYKKPLKGGEQTTPIMDRFTILNGTLQNSNAYTDLKSVVEFDADAIQVVAAQSAMLAEWGIIADMKGDTIQSIKEQ
ncbi:MAG: hypothetical protein RR275_00070 [Lachnospiraceae bacterium]